MSVHVQPYERKNHPGRVSDQCNRCQNPATQSIWFPAYPGTRGVTRREALCDYHAAEKSVTGGSESLLDVARETNRRLNRHVQVLEHDLRVALGRVKELTDNCPYRAELERLKPQNEQSTNEEHNG